jgi:hypothetical protein
MKSLSVKEIFLKHVTTAMMDFRLENGPFPDKKVRIDKKDLRIKGTRVRIVGNSRKRLMRAYL